LKERQKSNLSAHYGRVLQASNWKCFCRTYLETIDHGILRQRNRQIVSTGRIRTCTCPTKLLQVLFFEAPYALTASLEWSRRETRLDQLELRALVFPPRDCWQCSVLVVAFLACENDHVNDWILPSRSSLIEHPNTSQTRLRITKVVRTSLADKSARHPSQMRRIYAITNILTAVDSGLQPNKEAAALLTRKEIHKISLVRPSFDAEDIIMRSPPYPTNTRASSVLHSPLHFVELSFQER
jgi:hypothetical protein